MGYSVAGEDLPILAGLLAGQWEENAESSAWELTSTACESTLLA